MWLLFHEKNLSAPRHGLLESGEYVEWASLVLDPYQGFDESDGLDNQETSFLSLESHALVS